MRQHGPLTVAVDIGADAADGLIGVVGNHCRLARAVLRPASVVAGVALLHGGIGQLQALLLSLLRLRGAPHVGAAGGHQVPIGELFEAGRMAR